LGTLLSYIGWRSMHDAAWLRRRPSGSLLGMDIIAIGIGGGIAVSGVAAGNPRIALAGVPLIALGLLWRLIKRSVPPR